MIEHSPVWHPFTQHALESRMKRIVKTQDAYLIDEDGNEILDAISSWWVITHGHRHPVIVKAISDAASHMDQVIFAEYTHEYADKLASELVNVSPSGLDYVFYSDSGSTAVEVAIKMALGYHKNSGQPRSRIVVMEHGYHGDTIGTMSVGERGVFNAAYEPLLFEVNRLPFPSPGNEQITLDAFERFCVSQQVSALVIEPLVLGAGGFKIYPAWVLKELKCIADRYNTLVIADEVMTGWGRTGTLFACEQAMITPDILCTSKGLTGGVIPLAATLCSRRIYEAHYSPDRQKTFFHSSSYTANPIACAAGLANIQIWKTEPVQQRMLSLIQMHQARIKLIGNDARFSNIRQIGTIVAFDMNAGSVGYLSSVGPKLRAFFRQRNLLIRPLGNVIYLMMPYCVTSQDLDATYQAIIDAAEIIEEKKR